MLTSLLPRGWEHYLAGGLLIGAGVALLYVLTGRVGGTSTVLTSTWSYVLHGGYFRQSRFLTSRSWRLVFALGLVLGAATWWWWLGDGATLLTTVPEWRLLLGGVLVGYGARWANGCISGHGMFGLGSLQWPSVVVVFTFMATAVITANLMLHWTSPR